MNAPWIARSSHQAIVALLTKEVSELKVERRTLLDRLAVLGLGGPLYSAQEPTDGLTDVSAPEEDEVTEAAGLEQEMVDELLRLRRRPAKLADALTRSLRRPQSQRRQGPRVAWISEGDPVNAALDQAEELGRRRAAGSARVRLAPFETVSPNPQPVVSHHDPRVKGRSTL